MSRHARIIEALTMLVDDGHIVAFNQDEYANVWLIQISRHATVSFTSGEVEAFLTGVALNS